MTETGARTCRHCGGEIIPCTEHIRYCKGWKHVAYLHYGPLGPHYCGGRSVNPMAEPRDDSCLESIAIAAARTSSPSTPRMPAKMTRPGAARLAGVAGS